MIYKTLKKVSDVCQLLDKRRYSATKTVNGVTFTNNGDGTFTVNGTATAMIDYRGVSNNAKINVVVGHKYLMRGCPAGGSKNTYDMRLPFLGLDYGNGVIAKLTDSGDAYYVQIIVRAGIVCDNLVFKPQLFDLTEMYGAGNEPTTVEQFRQDFPDEIYDYKPYCFVKSYKTLLKATDNKIITSYKKSLVCKTKNLFDISKVKETDTLKIIGNSIYSYKYPAATEEATTLSIFKSLKPDTNYTMSAFCPNFLGNGTNEIILAFNNNTTIHVFDNYAIGFAQKTFSLTQEQIDNIIRIYFYGSPESNGGPTIWNNIQLELGNTATEYVPYGHL